MSKKQETSYKSNELTANQKRFYTNALVHSQDNLWYRFKDEVNAGTRIMSPRALYKDWADFEVKSTIESLEPLYFVLFDKKADKKLLADKVELSVQVWIRLCETSIDRTNKTTAGGNTGAKRTNHKLADRKYEVVKFEIAADVKLPPQAKTCMEFFKELAAAAKHDDAKGIFEIPEKDFQAYVVLHAERLKTRQDPWRIFQYYRPQLIQLGHLRLV